MPEETKRIFSQETLDTYFEASMMEEITLEKLRGHKEKYDAFITFTLFYLKRFFSTKRPTYEDITRALDLFLTDEACWINVGIEELFDTLINEDGLALTKAGTYTVLLKIEGRWSKQKALAYLQEKWFFKIETRRIVLKALQEKNRAVNSRKVTANASRDRKFMHLALEKAREAALDDEVPVGAVLVREDGKVLAATHNRVIAEHNATAHAEMLAIWEASQKLKKERLNGTTLYVTLEPCPMCAAAILHARISRVVWGADDLKAGALGGAMDMENLVDLNWCLDRKGGVLKKDCEKLITDFFKAKREKSKDDQ